MRAGVLDLVDRALGSAAGRQHLAEAAAAITAGSTDQYHAAGDLLRLARCRWREPVIGRSRRTCMSALRRILSTVLALVFAVGITAGPLAGGAAAAGAIPPAPVPEPAICVDLPGVLGAETCRKVTAKLEADEKATGDELAVLVVRTTGDESIEEYALRAFNTWGVGQAGEDNGVLLVVALDDRTVRIQVGSGLEKTVTDGRAREIIGAELVPMFRAGSYRQGILQRAGRHPRSPRSRDHRFEQPGVDPAGPRPPAADHVEGAQRLPVRVRPGVGGRGGDGGADRQLSCGWSS